VYKKEIVSWLTDGMNDEVQGQLLARQWLTNFASGIPLSVWYDWHDDGPDPNDPEAHCGIVFYPYHEGQKPVYTPKPSYWAARTLTAVLTGYRFEQRLQIAEPEDYVLVFRRRRAVRLAAWTVANSPHTVRIPVKDEPCSMIGYKGDNAGALSVAKGEVALSLSNAPQYLVCGKGQIRLAG
jgi:hypothetical protein